MKANNRITLNRSIEKYDRGFDIVNNRTFSEPEVMYELDCQNVRTKPQVSNYYRSERLETKKLHEVPIKNDYT